MIESTGGGFTDERRKAQDRQRALIPCYACGARGDEKHDSEAHREYARESRVY